MRCQPGFPRGKICYHSVVVLRLSTWHDCLMDEDWMNDMAEFDDLWCDPMEMDC